MYSSVGTDYTLDMSKITGDDNWDEVQLMILTGGLPDKTSVAKSASAVSTMSLRSVATVVEPITLYQSESSLKIDFNLDERVNIKVLNAKTDLPVYMRQYIPGGSSEVLIKTSKWHRGYYNIVFTNSSGEVVAKGTVYID